MAAAVGRSTRSTFSACSGPWVHRVAVVGGAPGEEWGYMRKKEKENKPTLSGRPCR